MPYTIRAHIIEGGQDHQPPIARTIKGNLRDAQQWLSDRAAEFKELAWERGQIEQAKSLATIQEELAQLRSPHYSSTDLFGAKFEIWPRRTNQCQAPANTKSSRSGSNGNLTPTPRPFASAPRTPSTPFAS